MSRASAGTAGDEIGRAYYRGWFRYHPEAAVDAGVPGYAGLLTPYRDDDMGALVCLNDELRVSLEELDRGRLDQDRLLDYDLLYNAALLENQYLLDIESRRPDPERLLPVNAVYQLTIRPVTDFADALMARLNAIPDHLLQARDHLRPKARGIPPLWLRSAVTAARQGVEFFRSLPAHPKIAGRSQPAGLDPALTRATQALADYADFLEQDLAAVASGEFACGAAYFDNLLRRRHFLDVTPDDLHVLGQELLARTTEELRALCRKHFGADDIAAATRKIKTDHPPAAELLAAYRRQMRAAREFVAKHDLVGLPPREHLEVVETPAFLRHQIPFAAYCEPSPNDPEQHGYYYVTPPVDAEQLAEHDNAGLRHTCVHEAWPGHHLQFVTANMNPAARTLPRLLNPSATLYEGWALYCEQLMREEGFLCGPEQHFIMLRDRLWRALRVLIDIELHTRGLGLEAAADRMVTLLGFPRSQALADLTWYSRAPTVPLGYATGWAMINALRARLRGGKAPFRPRKFHDRLLSAGSIALPLAIRRKFGAKAWADVKSNLFGGARETV
ncbi:MAG: hypothetical protein A2V92_06040 [Candidatus Muproteobacteria bacterium RBG_16_65_31]|uniref:DUF885 domain-containing protein n=1 Tax=Candidatus Muproteobacteria bacterium RBG_16_65_31 TaxID=1817759 RepID=A0A1F6TDI9_9PROT|nr:MAG: hypothetical protein A2V92_06040 [Candidatus Muproteobacteria bacterium RBG_16_65_31]